MICHQSFTIPDDAACHECRRLESKASHTMAPETNTWKYA
jgi:hypothetical protein